MEFLYWIVGYILCGALVVFIFIRNQIKTYCEIMYNALQKEKSCSVSQLLKVTKISLENWYDIYVVRKALIALANKEFVEHFSECHWRRLEYWPYASNWFKPYKKSRWYEKNFRDQCSFIEFHFVPPKNSK
jgi:hypothetical protein